MTAVQHGDDLALVSLEGLSLRDLGRFGESVIIGALGSVLGAGEADGEIVASFANEGDKA
ncbi:FXSXX-COOH protein [Nocardiopsis sp. N85]|uniref:FXSXX-COOH protein n=1 Tax=Nocardiopsis sp. N85 TaxID=3029400 RepID=UPI00237F5AB7|nr:FXSXX-COOH protein [Nocardiopsis sp. N85]MDE3723344.1 FXSXX-COOH protein [Nocardiopsis sp. N85]